MIDKDLEAAIDSVGRDRVFSAARALGWTSDSLPPKYVWWEIVHRLRSAEQVAGD